MTKKQGYYNPFERYEWVEYVEEDADEDATPFRAKVRSNLTNGEMEELVWERNDDEGKPIPVRENVFPLFAPFVAGWNVKIVNDEGELVDVDPPSVAGPDQFDYIPMALFWELVRDIKLRSTGRIDPKRVNRRSPVAAPTSSSDATSPEVT